MSKRTATVSLLLAALTACSSKEETVSLNYCDPANPACGTGEACEAVVGDNPACFPGIHIVGTVFDVRTPATKLDDARVVAFDVNGFPMSDVATTANGGQYDLVVHAMRDRNGYPAAGTSAMLRADKQGYFSFPSGLRPSLPIDLTLAALTDAGLVVDANVTNLVDVGLLTDSNAGAYSISGAVAMPSNGAGVLVVAEPTGASAVAASDGTFVIYNLAAGVYEVRAYSAGVVYTPGSADLTAPGSVSGLQIDVDGSTQTGTVSGGLTFVNPGHPDPTSVILVVKSTFDAAIVRGEAPPGLRAGGLSTNNSSFTIVGVPPGDYVALAAYENDGLVRDPDAAISGTDIQYFTMSAGGNVSLDSFKVTGALNVNYPGATGIESVSSVPVLSWADDSSESGYEVTVLNALGEIVLRDLDVPSSSGADPTYTWSATLVPGMTYQFKVVSWKSCQLGRCRISATEDLKGLFVYNGP